MSACPVHPAAERETCPECVIRGEQAWEQREDRLGDLDTYEGWED